jgi:hypothetical protein
MRDIVGKHTISCQIRLECDNLKSKKVLFNSSYEQLPRYFRTHQHIVVVYFMSHLYHSHDSWFTENVTFAHLIDFVFQPKSINSIAVI